jgi:hypothetical protein
VRSDAADSLRETVRMKGEQPGEVGFRESQREGVEERRGECKGRLKGWGFGRAEIFADEVEVAEGNG